MPKKDHTQEFLNALKEELKKDKPEKDPRISRLIERSKAMNRPIPPSMLINRVLHTNRRLRNQEGNETWISLAGLVYEMWEEENYPNEEDEVEP